MIQYANYFIDNVQTVKTQFVDTFVNSDEVKKPLKTYIDAQTSFAKAVVKEVNNFFTTTGASVYFFDPKNLWEQKTAKSK